MMRVLFMFSLGALFFMSSPAKSEQAKPANTPQMPATVAEGEKLFHSYCAGCHGEKAAGTTRGPSFLSPIYKPDHHGDESFVFAAMNGVRSHHWNFGDMPPVPGVSPGEVRKIIGYVRWLQTQAWSAHP